VNLFDPAWFDHHRRRLHHWRHDNLLQVLEDIRDLEAQILAALQGPVTVTVHHGGTMGTYAPGTPIKFTAQAENAEAQPVTTTFSWTASAGTITADDPTGATATLVNAPIGDVTVTATADNGVQGSDTATVADQTVVTVTVTDAAA